MGNHETFSRRRFIQVGATAAGGLVLGMPQALLAKGSTKALEDEETGPVDLGFFVRIDPDNHITIGSSQPEMGQGVMTSFPMIIAEEIGADWDNVSIEQLPLGLVLDATTANGLAWKHVPQGAGGSFSIIMAWSYLRPFAARARLMLIGAAAQKWGVRAAECRTEKSFVHHDTSGRSVPFAEIASLAAAQGEPEEAPFKAREDFTLLGTPQHNQQNHDIVAGRAGYGIDAELPDMVYAVMERCPQFDGSVGTIDDTEALGVEGVIAVVPVAGPDLGAPYETLSAGVAVVATSQWAAIKGCKKLRVSWVDGPNSTESSQGFSVQLDDLLSGNGQVVSDDGDFIAALDGAAHTFNETYEVPYIAHATLEPQNCVAWVQDDHAHIIAPTQSPAAASRAVNRLTGIPRIDIVVEMTRIGSGFGRRLTVDYVAEATLISMAVKKPVKLLWTREDDMTQDFYRPAGKHNMVASVDAAGDLTGIAHRLASATKWYRRASLTEDNHWIPELYEGDFPKGLVENYRREYFSAASGVPRGSWRAPGHTANAFAMQSFFDEIAHATDQDPLGFRLKLLEGKDHVPFDDETTFMPERMAGVLKLAAEKSGWGDDLPKGYGRGIAAHFTFSSYCAWVVDVKVANDGSFRVTRAVGAIDCGLAVNPAGVRQQMIGGANDALSTALHQEITIAGGGAQQTNFDTYRMMRMDESILVYDVHIVDSPYDPTGMGEIATPPFAPALCNALFDATGKRIRKLPIAGQLA